MPKRTSDYRTKFLEDLRDTARAANYLNAALDDSGAMFLIALRDVAEANRMAKVAEEAGLSREALYRTLSEEGNPRLSSLLGILGVMNLRINIAVQQELATVSVATSNYCQVSAGEAARQENTRPISLLAKLTDQYSKCSQREQNGPSSIMAYAGH